MYHLLLLFLLHSSMIESLPSYFTGTHQCIVEELDDLWPSDGPEFAPVLSPDLPAQVILVDNAHCPLAPRLKLELFQDPPSL